MVVFYVLYHMIALLLQKCVKNILWIFFKCSYPKTAKQKVMVFLLYPLSPHIFKTANMFFIATWDVLETSVWMA